MTSEECAQKVMDIACKTSDPTQQISDIKAFCKEQGAETTRRRVNDPRGQEKYGDKRDQPAPGAKTQPAPTGPGTPIP